MCGKLELVPEIDFLSIRYSIQGGGKFEEGQVINEEGSMVDNSELLCQCLIGKNTVWRQNILAVTVDMKKLNEVTESVTESLVIMLIGNALQ